MRTLHNPPSPQNALNEEGQIDWLEFPQVRGCHEDDIRYGGEKAKHANRRRQQLCYLHEDTFGLCDNYCSLMDGYDTTQCETAIIDICGCLGLLDKQLEVFHGVVVFTPPTPENHWPWSDGLLQDHVLVYFRVQIWALHLQLSTNHGHPIASWMFQRRAGFGARIVCCANRGWHV